MALLAVSAAIAGALSLFFVARDYRQLDAALLTGGREGMYYALGARLEERAKQSRANLTARTTAGSVENIERLIADRDVCREKFAFVQDGIPVPAGADLALLGRLPEPESLVLLTRKESRYRAFADLRGVSIGIGPDGSGTDHLMRQLFGEPDFAPLGIRLSNHPLEEQARMTSAGEIDIAALVIRDDAKFIRDIVGRYDLDIVALQDLKGLIGRYPWLSIGQIPAGRFDLVNPAPATEKSVPQVSTLIVANACAKRAERIALLVLLGAELPQFVRANPPAATSDATKIPLGAEARQFFLTGEPDFADQYFPWLVNLMSPAYWVYLAMAATALFNGLRGLSRFRLWRIDAAREKLELTAERLVGSTAGDAERAAARGTLDRLAELRARCQRYVGSFVTPMGDEMFYRYQQTLIDAAIDRLGGALGAPAKSEAGRASAP